MVLGACTTTKNPIHAPYILMGAIVGLNLANNGNGEIGIYNVPEQFRSKFMDQLIDITCQVERFTFSSIGRLEFCEDSQSYSIAGSPLFGGGPFQSANDYYTNLVELIRKRYESAQFSPLPENRAQAMFIPWVAKEMVTRLRFGVMDSGLYSFAHGDAGIHNVIVDGEWNIIGLLDWEVSLS
jgi:hypothetical protein